MTSRHLPAEAAALLDALVAGVEQALSLNLVGVYLRGSLAAGGSDPAVSDIDCLVVTEHSVSDAKFAALATMHMRLAERYHPIIGPDWPFQWAQHRDNWILERGVVREHGVASRGPDPKTLIDPISADDLRRAAEGPRSRSACCSASLPAYRARRFFSCRVRAVLRSASCRAPSTKRASPSSSEFFIWGPRRHLRHIWHYPKALAEGAGYSVSSPSSAKMRFRSSAYRASLISFA